MKFLIFTLFFLFTTVYGEKTDRLPCNCRLGNMNRIVNGQVANKHFIPWMVFLVHSKGYCGGTIVNKNYILTAAYCVDNIPAQNITVHLGLHNLSELNDSSIYKGKNIITADFDRLSKEGNFALIELDRPIEFITGQIEPACFSFQNGTFEGDLMTAGWGRTARSYFNLTKFYHLPRNNNNLKYFFGTQTTEDCKNLQICLKSKNKEDDACYGDEGGPLMFTKDGQTSVIGINSEIDGFFLPSNPITTMCNIKSLFTPINSHKILFDQYAPDYCKVLTV